MKKIIVLSICVCTLFISQAQNLEIRSGKDIKQPGLINPSLAGLQEDMFRLLTNANLNDFTFMAEGKIPFKLGNYMIGVDRISNEYVSNSMFNLTYGKTSKQDKNLQFRYGGSLQINTRTSIKTDGDTSGFTFIDLNGEATQFSSLTDLTGKLSYLNLEAGASMQYKELIVSLGLQNIMNPDVSLVNGTTRKLPMSVNLMVGGFLNLGKNNTLFPSVIGVYNADGYYAKASLDLNTQYFNIATAYIADHNQQDFAATLAMHYKKMYFGLIYSQPLAGLDNNPVFRVFLNTGLFKDRKLFKSKFADNISKFY